MEKGILMGVALERPLHAPRSSVRVLVGALREVLEASDHPSSNAMSTVQECDLTACSDVQRGVYTRDEKEIGGT